MAPSADLPSPRSQSTGSATTPAQLRTSSLGAQPQSRTHSVGSQAHNRAQRYRDEIKSFPVTLVTGGTGYIGSHTVLELLIAGIAVVVVDNLCNSHLESLCRVYYIAQAEAKRLGADPKSVPPVYFHQADIRDDKVMGEIFTFWQSEVTPARPTTLPISIGDTLGSRSYTMLDYKIDTAARTKAARFVETEQFKYGRISAVIHFAALKAVGESISRPIDYYQTNVNGLLILLKTMRIHNVKVLIFSSSAVVYGKGHEAAISEDSVHVAGQGSGGGLLTNPYGRSKWMCEEIINDYCVADTMFRGVALRYFNPTGSHPSALIGEDPRGVPNNIVPVILQAYQRRRSKVHVFGSNYDTADGTGVRDYIHVTDLARGHLAAMRKAVADLKPVETIEGGSVQEPGENYSVYNLGTGRGYSVLEIIKAFSSAAGVDVPYEISDARPGDLGTVTASASKAHTELEWEAAFDLQDMCRDVFNWAAANPKGYETLRRLSVLSTGSMDASHLRKASVATGIFENEESFDNFMANNSASIARGSFGRGSVSSRKGSVAFASMMQHLRTDSLAPVTPIKEDSPQSFSNQFAAPFNKPAAPMWKVSWNESQQRPGLWAAANALAEDDDVPPDSPI